MQQKGLNQCCVSPCFCASPWPSSPTRRYFLPGWARSCVVWTTCAAAVFVLYPDRSCWTYSSALSELVWHWVPAVLVGPPQEGGVSAVLASLFVLQVSTIVVDSDVTRHRQPYLLAWFVTAYLACMALMWWRYLMGIAVIAAVAFICF